MNNTSNHRAGQYWVISPDHYWPQQTTTWITLAITGLVSTGSSHLTTIDLNNNNMNNTSNHRAGQYWVNSPDQMNPCQWLSWQYTGRPSVLPASRCSRCFHRHSLHSVADRQPHQSAVAETSSSYLSVSQDTSDAPSYACNRPTPAHRHRHTQRHRHRHIQTYTQRHEDRLSVCHQLTAVTVWHLVTNCCKELLPSDTPVVRGTALSLQRLGQLSLPPSVGWAITKDQLALYESETSGANNTDEH